MTTLFFTIPIQFPMHYNCLLQLCLNSVPVLTTPMKIVQGKCQSPNCLYTETSSLEDKVDKILSTARKLSKKSIKKIRISSRVKKTKKSIKDKIYIKTEA